MARRKTAPKKTVITVEAIEAARAVSDFLLLEEIKRRCDNDDAFRTLMTEAVEDRLLLSDMQLKNVCENHDQKLYDADDVAEEFETAVWSSEPMCLAARIVFDADATAVHELKHMMQRDANIYGSHAARLL
jgi:hypothetical protein